MNLSALGYLGEQLSQHNIQNANSGLQMNEKVTGSWKIYFIIFWNRISIKPPYKDCGIDKQLDKHNHPVCYASQYFSW